MRAIHTLCVLLLLAGLALGGQPAVSNGDVDGAVAALAKYEPGQPRLPLYQIEQIVRQANSAVKKHLAAKLGALLQLDTVYDVQLFACQQLWIIGSDDSVAALAPLLADEERAHMACYALGREPSAKADAALLAALPKAKAKARAQILEALGERRVGAGVAAVARFARAGEPAAVSALGKIADDGSAQTLAKLRKDAKTAAAAQHASLRCARRMADAGNVAAAQAIYRELMDARHPQVIRRGALLGLLAATGDEAIPLLLSTLRGKDAMLRAAAIASLGSIRGETVVKRLAAELPTLSAETQTLVVEALASRGGPAARKAVLSVAMSESPEVRAAVLTSLITVGDASDVPILAAAVASGATDAERAAAGVALRKLDGKDIDAAILDALPRAKGAHRGDLICILADRGAGAAVPALLTEARTGDTRKDALKALAILATPQHVPQLLQVLAAVPDDVRRDAERAVASAARRSDDEASRADAVLEALAQAKDRALRSSLLRVLRSIGNAKAFVAVQAALRQPDLEDTAVRELAAWPDTRAVPALCGVFDTSKTDVHRTIALRGCVRLLALPGKNRAATYRRLMKRAERPDTRKLILPGLATLGDPAAFGMIESWLSEAQVRAEAEQAMLQAARALAASAPKETKAAMARLAAATNDPNVRKQAQAIGRKKGPRPGGRP